ncbi:MAG: c-type cytochrome [Bdellovibrionales bacterium]|nr:c-type cytochrome [Bdellovibrionales bacterium]
MAEKHGNHHKHHILAPKIIWTVWALLLIGTALTVGATHFHFGAVNYVIGILIATIKAALVVTFFMGLKYDSNENRVIFLTSFVFVAIFFVLTMSDLFFRGPVEFDNGRFLAAQEAHAAAQSSDPWISTPELVAKGKELYAAQCVVCHGVNGKGDGPAAGALNPKPRNFTAQAGWVNGRKPSEIFGSLTKGLNAMPSFATSPAPDRWALAHYVSTLGPSVLKDSPEDLKKVGAGNASGGGGGEKTLPIDLAIEIMSSEG